MHTYGHIIIVRNAFIAAQLLLIGGFVCYSQPATKQLLQMFEPVVLSAVQKYKFLHRVDIQQVIISMIARLLHFGVSALCVMPIYYNYVTLKQMHSHTLPASRAFLC